MGLPSPAVAQTFDIGVRTAAMGQASTTESHAGDAVINNPADLVTDNAYTIEGAYHYRKDSHVISAAVTDSKTNPVVSAGVGYSFMLGKNALEGYTGHDVHFGLAFPAIENRLAVGVGGRYTWIFQEIPGQEDKLEIVNGFTMSAGTLVRIVDQLKFGFSALNLIPQCEKKVCESFMPMVFKTGLGYSNFGLTVALDVDFDITRGDPAIDVGVGAEYVIVDMIPVRLGYRRVDFVNADDGNVITAGLGFHSSIVDVNVTYQVDVSHEDSHSVLAGVAVKL